MEDLSALQDNLNQEYKQRKRDELKTPAGIKKAVGDKVGLFMNRLMTRKHYQYTLAIVLIYITSSGLWFVFSHLLSWFTVVVIGLCLLVIFWDNLKWISLKIKTWIKKQTNIIRGLSIGMYHYIGYKVYTLKQYIRGTFKSDK